MTARRLPVAIAVGGLLAGVVAGGSLAGRGPSARFGPEIAYDMPNARPAGALSSTWYCPANPAGGRSTPQGSIVLANPADRDVEATLTAVADSGRMRQQQVVVQKRSTQAIAASTVLDANAPWVGVLVEADGGRLVVEHSVSTSTTAGVAPCSSSASDRWYFATGVTTVDVKHTLVVFNPFPADAVVDVTFATDEGRFAPPELDGLVVPARSVVPVELTEQVRRREELAMSLVARTGRVVVDRVISYNGKGDEQGIVVTPAIPSAGRTWYFPDSFHGQGISQAVAVYNPGESTSVVAVTAALPDGVVDAELRVPAGGYTLFDVSKEQNLPQGIPHALTLEVTRGPAVVAERKVVGSKESDRRGVSISPGARRTATEWLVAVGEAGDSADTWIVVQNPGDRTVTVELVAYRGGRSVPSTSARRRVAAGGRLALHVTKLLPGEAQALSLTATGPVVVERDVNRVDGLGLVDTMAIPVDG